MRIKVSHCGICHSDYNVQTGLWGSVPPCPCVLGHEIVGKVESVGKLVNRFKVGELVGATLFHHSCGKCDFCLEGNNVLCTNMVKYMRNSSGGFGTHVDIQQDWTFPIPLSLKPAHVAPLLCAGITAWSPIDHHC